MISRVVPKEERSATERLQVILAAIDGLQDLERERGLNPLQTAALTYLETIYFRGIRFRGELVTDQQISQPLAVARRAMEGNSRLVTQVHSRW